MELNLRAPNFPGYYSYQDKLAMFEPFWDSSVPRFGEPQAPGWSKAPKAAMPHHGTKEEGEEDELVGQYGGKIDEIQLWLRLELLREYKHWLPLRVAADEDDDEVEDSERMYIVYRSLCYISS